MPDSDHEIRGGGGGGGGLSSRSLDKETGRWGGGGLGGLQKTFLGSSCLSLVQKKGGRVPRAHLLDPPLVPT